MDLTLDFNLANNYKSHRQKTRVVSESWLGNNIYCPVCGNPLLTHYKANMPVADFFCEKCHSDFELKSRESKTKTISKIIPDGAYKTMIQRITSSQNPHLFVMTYSDSKVDNLILIPKFFFVPNIIIKRPPLSSTARRAGWEGCNINIGVLPSHGKIYLIEGSRIVDKKIVQNKYSRILGLQTNSIDSRGWLFDTLSCIDKLPSDLFSLSDMYIFESELANKHPNNNFIKDKIRQQLQLLRDKGIIEFIGRGKYKKIQF